MDESPFDFSEFFEGDEDNSWVVPEYLANMYALWTMMGVVGDQLNRAHIMSEISAEGNGDNPPDNILAAFLDAPSDAEEEGKDVPITAHDLIRTAEAAVMLLINSIADRLRALDALPPWWKDNYDAAKDRPVMGWEILMLRQLLEEREQDEDGTEG